MAIKKNNDYYSTKDGLNYVIVTKHKIIQASQIPQHTHTFKHN